MIIAIVTSRVTDSISIVPPHHSIASPHPHYPISRMVIAVMSPWTQVIILLSRDVHYHLVLIVIAVIVNQSLAIVLTVARQVISQETAHPINKHIITTTNNVPLL